MARKLTIADIVDGYDHDDWAGYGYLGARRDDLTDIEATRAMDERAVAEANARGWTPEQFFNWLDSKNGRWFAESFFHSPDSFERDVPGLMKVPE